MTCPICGGATTVTHTIDHTDHIIRYRKCVECRVTFRTIETDDIPIYKKGKNGNVESK